MRKMTRMASRFASLFVLIFVVASIATSRVSADGVDDALAAPNNAAVSLLPACKGIPIARQREALKLIKSEVCTALTQLLSGTQTGNDIGTDIRDVYADLHTDLELTPICSASLMGVFVQRLITGKISAGSCPAGN
jgi:hypothetical protein